MSRPFPNSLILNQINYFAPQQTWADNACGPSNRLKSVDSAQSQQVAPFFCYYSRPLQRIGIDRSGNEDLHRES
jgi:hypothetical protein